VIETNDGHVELRRLFGRNAEYASTAAPAESAAAKSAATAAETAANALLSAAARTTTKATAATPAAAKSAAADLGQHGHSGKRRRHLHVEWLLRFVGNKYARGSVALGDELGIKMPILHGLKELNGRSIGGFVSLPCRTSRGLGSAYRPTGH
jgi:hypothetical protein